MISSRLHGRRDHTALAHLGSNLVCRNVVELVKRLQRHLATEDVPLHPVRQRLGDLVAHVDTSGHCKDVVELLEGALLGLRDPEEDHDQGSHVQATVS